MRSGKRFIAGAAALIFFVGLAWYFSDTPSHDGAQDLRGQSGVSVVLTDRGFEPRQILVNAGTTVTWSTTRKNEFWPASNAHPSHTLYPEFDPKVPLSSNETWSFTFDKEGTWEYHDHVRSYFTGTIDVVK